jgi:protein-tyrosine phosphatase
VGPSSYISLGAEDVVGFPLIRDYYETFEKVMDMFLREPGCRCVYVHCHAGMNRSATLLAAYLHKRFGIPMEKVVEVMAKQRPCVMTNPSFVEQLEEFGSRGKNK